MAEFVGQWQQLSAEERNAAEESIALGQMTNAIYKKLLEERALSALGDESSALEKQRKFVSFAEKLGISDPRIALPDTPPSSAGKPADAMPSSMDSGSGAFNEALSVSTPALAERAADQAAANA